MKIYKISNEADFALICERIGVRNAGRAIMQKKSRLNFFYLKDLHAPAANILKQDALSIGAELACNEEVILGRDGTDAVLIANDRQIEALAQKEALQDFGLKEVAKFLSEKFAKPQSCEIMGVVNINSDSFNPASRAASLKEATNKIEKMIEQGAAIIDLGGVSSRPGSQYCGRDEEFARIKDIVNEIYRLRLHERAKFSLDSFDEYCLEFALDRGFSIINDISANLTLAPLALRYDAAYVLMHMQGKPQNMQLAPKYDDLMGEIDEFFAQNLQQLQSAGLKKIILDVGIGFGKTAEQNLVLIKNLQHFLHFGCPLLVGASRKSVIDFYSPSAVSDRLAGSLYLHQIAALNGAAIIRTHDVFEHAQMLRLMRAMDAAAVKF